jgi:hypothetical protein
LGCAEADYHGAILEDDFVGAAFGLFDLALDYARRDKIYCGHFLAEMERDGLEAEEFDEGGGE